MPFIRIQKTLIGQQRAWYGVAIIKTAKINSRASGLSSRLRIGYRKLQIPPQLPAAPILLGLFCFWGGSEAKGMVFIFTIFEI